MFRGVLRRPFVRTAALARPRVPQLQRRNFQKIVVSNPVGVWLLDASKGVLKGILIFYGAALVIGGGLYAAGAYYLKEHQEIASDFSLVDKIYARLAVYYQDVVENEAVAENTLIKTLQSIAQEEGISKEGDLGEDGKKFKLLNMEQFNSHSKEWKNTYIDMVVRLALVKADLGDVVNASKLNLYAINVPMDLGNPDLRSQSLRLAGRISSLDQDYSKAENYLLDCIKFNEFYQSDIIFQNEGSLLLDPSSNINNETFHALLDLGVNYSNQKQYSKSLEIFLNLLQIAADNRTKENSNLHLKQSDIPLLKNYIGELLYKKGLLSKSIEWCNESFKEAFKASKNDVKSAWVTRHALENLIKLYDKVGDEELKKQAEEQHEQVDVHFVKEANLDVFSLIF